MRIAICAVVLATLIGAGYLWAASDGGGCCGSEQAKASCPMQARTSDGACPMKAMAVAAEEGAGPTTVPSTQPAKPINAKCPIMKEDIDPTVTTTYDGKVIGFCCKNCIPEFQKDPAKYMAQMK